MCKQSEPVYLVRDDTFYSERDGSPAIYWSPANSWAAFRGASAVELSWSVLAADPTAWYGCSFRPAWTGSPGMMTPALTGTSANFKLTAPDNPIKPS